MIKKILIVGASGKTGLEVTRLAIQKGFEVSVLVRDKAKLGDLAEKVNVIEGDALDREIVNRAVDGQEAIISVIGPTKNSEPGMQPKATENIVNAMKTSNVKRLITMTGAGVRTTGDQPKFIDKAIRTIMQIVARKALKDGSDHAEVVKSSGLEWTIVRGPMLTDDTGTGNYKVGMVGEDHMSTKISRADVAKFILDTLDSKDFVGKMPMVSW